MWTIFYCLIKSFFQLTSKFITTKTAASKCDRLKRYTNATGPCKIGSLFFFLILISNIYTYIYIKYRATTLLCLESDE